MKINEERNKKLPPSHLLMLSKNEEAASEQEKGLRGSKEICLFLLQFSFWPFLFFSFFPRPLLGRHATTVDFSFYAELTDRQTDRQTDEDFLFQCKTVLLR